MLARIVKHNREAAKPECKDKKGDIDSNGSFSVSVCAWMYRRNRAGIVRAADRIWEGVGRDSNNDCRLVQGGDYQVMRGGCDV